MSRGTIPNYPGSAMKGFTSTPVKNSQQEDLRSLEAMEDVLSEDEDTFSLLSPIYHDSFESDEEELELSGTEGTSPRLSDHSGLSISPIRCELPKTPSEKMFTAAVQSGDSFNLTAWEEWLVNKAKEQRIRLQKKAEEEHQLNLKKQRQEMERIKQNLIGEQKIQEWLRLKRAMERKEQLEKQEKEEEEAHKQFEKHRESQCKARQKYKDWLQQKNQEKLVKETKEKEQAALKEEQEKQRREIAEARFKEWLSKANEKSRTAPKSPSSSKSPYDNLTPSPSFCNPIPWKPIHVPPPEITLQKSSDSKQQKKKKKR